MSLELKPEKVKVYLKLLTEACLFQNQNQGSLRKDLWEYLHGKYGDSIDYRDFLLAIRRFLQEGKILNNDGIFEMHPEVIHEVREKTPTPALKSKIGDGKVSDGNLFLKLLTGELDDGQTASSKKKRGNQYLYDSKISDSGKQQKIKRVADNTTQSKIEKYYTKKHANNSKDFLELENIGAGQSKPLGFATPAFDMKVMNGEFEEDEDSYEKETPTKIQKENVSKRMTNLQKQKAQQAKSEAKKKQIEQQMQQVSKKIQKKQKGFSNEKDQGNKKNHHDKKNSKQQQNQQSEENEHKSNQKELLDKTLQIEAERLKQRQRAEKDERKRQLKEKKEKVLEKQKQKLTSSVIKALKQAFQSKNLQHRKQLNTISQAQKQQQSKIKKTKAIKKVSQLKHITSVKKDKIKSKRILKSLRNKNWEPKLMTNRLRGKTLDLTELGIIKKKKEVPMSLSRQSTLRLDKSEEREQRATSTSRQASRQASRRSSVQRQLPKTKAIKKTDKKQHTKKQEKKQKTQKQPEVKKPKRYVAVIRETRVDHDRKAKLDAVKNLRQLYSKDKLKHALYIDEKLIYL